MASSSAGQDGNGASLRLEALAPLKPNLNQRAWASVPHPTLPLLATCHSKAVTIYSLSTLSSYSSLTGGHARSVRDAAWKPALPPHKLCLVTGSFDSTAAVWRWDGENQIPFESSEKSLEFEITRSSTNIDNDDASSDKSASAEWEYTLVLEGHESEVKSVAFSPAGQYLATCSRDKSVWIWEDVGANEADDEWETVAVLTEHDADVKSLAWCPDVPGRNRACKGRYSADVLASSSYDDTIRIWREDGDGEWVCVAVLEGHGGTVWGIQWEADPKRTKFPRLMSFSADKTIRIWTMKQEDDDEEGQDGDEATAGTQSSTFRSGLGGIPNTMRASVREEWECTATLPAAHTRDVYSATWSATSGLIASTGSDGVIAVFREDQSSREWNLLTTTKNAHGPYEINHITWCRRYDAGSEARGTEEMLVTTGDDGVVRPWRVVSVTS